VANVGPALLGWLLVIMPAVIQAQQAHGNVGVAYMLAVSQTLALGPLLGLSQAVVLRAYTPRWAWWIAANLVSWLIVDLVVVAIQHFNPFDFSHGNDSIAELYLMMVATTPLTGRAILWVLAPSIVFDQHVAAPS
jgi:putative Mn2+ efflux pump MntP